MGTFHDQTIATAHSDVSKQSIASASLAAKDRAKTLRRMNGQQIVPERCTQETLDSLLISAASLIEEAAVMIAVMRTERENHFLESSEINA